MSGTFDAIDPRPHSVYRVYDADGQLLYIGCARNASERIRMHLIPSSRSETSWAIRQRMAHWESVEYPTKVAARAAERAAIAAELPLLNKQHNPRRVRKTPQMRYAARLADSP